MHNVILPIATLVAAALSGTVGFGGAILLLPILTGAVGVAKAVPILTVIQIVGNASRVLFACNEIDWAAARAYLITGVPFAMLGAYSFVSAPKTVILKLIGASILIFIGLKMLGISRWRVHRKDLPIAGAIVGYLSGLIGTAGPVGAVVFMSLKLSPLAYISTDAFSSLIMHITKSAVYHGASFGMSDTLMLTIVMCVTTIVGTFIGTKVAARIPKHAFQYAVITLVIISAVQMIRST
ncbi:MAG TPA: sulfite exporter TauE/SafE family protein [Oculatellaceae cyanobacterium]